MASIYILEVFREIRRDQKMVQLPGNKPLCLTSISTLSIAGSYPKSEKLNVNVILKNRMQAFYPILFLFYLFIIPKNKH